MIMLRQMMLLWKWKLRTPLIKTLRSVLYLFVLNSILLQFVLDTPYDVSFVITCNVVLILLSKPYILDLKDMPKNISFNSNIHPIMFFIDFPLIVLTSLFMFKFMFIDCAVDNVIIYEQLSDTWGTFLTFLVTRLPNCIKCLIMYDAEVYDSSILIVSILNVIRVALCFVIILITNVISYNNDMFIRHSMCIRSKESFNEEVISIDEDSK